jgi:predicted dehydrogenase
MNEIPGIAILGCGLIGQKRAKSLVGAKLRICADLDAGRAQQLAKSHPGAESTTDWRSAIHRNDVDIVVIATTNQALVEPASKQRTRASIFWSRSPLRATLQSSIQ